MIRRIKNKLSSLLHSDKCVCDDEIEIGISHSWSTDTGIGIRGWLKIERGPIEKIEIMVGDVTVPITSWHEQPDNTGCKPKVKCNFYVQIPRIAQHQATINVTQADKIFSRNAHFMGSPPVPPANYPDGSTLYLEFIKRVNDEKLNVLEIGSRIASPNGKSKRSLFPNAASYTGFDYYPDSNTDVVGDAHKLSSYFGDRKFDAVFSLVVLEHLAMPWVVAMEINKVLRMGGITFHETPFAWPAHARPWDFWRCSDEGLKVLFSSAMGFETIRAGMHSPLRMTFDELHDGQEVFPEGFCYGGSTIISKKVAEVNRDKFRWDVNLEDVLETGSHYPKM